MITELSEVKRLAGITDTSDDDILFEIQQRVEKWVQDSYCERIFEQATFTEYYSGSLQQTIMVKNTPLISVTGIWDDINRNYGSDCLIDPANYVFDANGIITLDAIMFMKGVHNIKITYVGGYLPKDMPYSIQQGITKLIVADYLTAKASVNAMSSSDVNDRIEKLRKDALLILSDYERVR